MIHEKIAEPAVKKQVGAMKKRDTTCQRSLKPAQMKFKRQKLNQSQALQLGALNIDRKIHISPLLRSPGHRSISWQTQNHRPQKTAKAHYRLPDFNQTTLH